jgi:hypothetical protein
VNNTGSINVNGPVTTAANGNITINALGSNVTETINSPVTAGGSGNVVLAALGSLSNININAVVEEYDWGNYCHSRQSSHAQCRTRR